MATTGGGMAVAVPVKAVYPLEAAVVEMMLVLEARMGMDRMLEVVGNAPPLEGDWVFQVDRDRRDTHKHCFKVLDCVALRRLFFIVAGLLCLAYNSQ
jgi:hypothetical protein